MTRNRDETRQRILDAALAALAEEGFGPFGVNSVARRAECDKKLIYRYFDGMEGLTEAMGAAVAEQLAEALAPHLEPRPTSYAEMMERLALALFDHLWGNAVYRQIKVMEVTAPSAATASFRIARGRAMQGWVVQARGDLTPPDGCDAAALNATIVGTVEGLCVLGAAGLDPADPASKARLGAVLGQIVRAAYANCGGGV